VREGERGETLSSDLHTRMQTGSGRDSRQFDRDGGFVRGGRVRKGKQAPSSSFPPRHPTLLLLLAPSFGDSPRSAPFHR